MTPKKALRTLKSLNKILRTRLILHDSIPSPFSEYLVHDGRVTFTVPSEFEVDLSVAGPPSASPFYFIDMRLMFEPSQSIYEDNFFAGFEWQVNRTLEDYGLMGCYNFLHNKALAKKVIILHRQAQELLRNDWMDSLHVEVVARTLIVRYWVDRPGPKSWIELSVFDPSMQRGSKIDLNALSTSYLKLKWVREGQEANIGLVDLNLTQLSLESILSSVIALHASRILQETHEKFLRTIPFARGHCHIGLNTSSVEPGDCYLDVQLTSTKHVKVIIEPISGVPAPQTTPPSFARVANKVVSDSLFTRIYRLRCIAAREETHDLLLKTGWVSVNPSTINYDEIRRSLPRDMYRTDLYRKENWDDTWAVAHATGANGETWWAMQFVAVTNDSFAPAGMHGTKNSFRRSQLILVKPHFIVNPFVALHLQNSFTTASISRLGLAMTGMICMITNHQSLMQLTKNAGSREPAQRLELLPDLAVPEISVKFKRQSLPTYLQVSPTVAVARDKFAILGEDVSLSFEGLEPESQRAVLLAHGTLKFSIHHIASCTPDDNFSVIFSEDGTSFTLRFLSPVGLPVITELFYQLQQLEQAINLALHLHHLSSQPTLKSFSRVDFIHPTHSFVRASVLLNYTENTPASLRNDTNKLASRGSSFAQCYLGLNFEPHSPYRRIEQSLTELVRHRGFRPGLGCMLRMLDYTIPLLQAFQRLHSQLQESRVRLISRSPRFYVLIYPRAKYRFHLFLILRRGKPVWIVRNATHAVIKAQLQWLETGLKSRIFAVKSQHWAGFENTAIVDVTTDSIGALLSTLDGVMREGGGMVPHNASAPAPDFANTTTPAAGYTANGPDAAATATLAYPNDMGSGMFTNGMLGMG